MDGLKKLQYIGIGDSAVNDDGLKQLAKLPNLGQFKLFITTSAATPAGRAAANKLPNVKVDN